MQYQRVTPGKSIRLGPTVTRRSGCAPLGVTCLTEATSNESGAAGWPHAEAAASNVDASTRIFDFMVSDLKLLDSA